ncbi:MAG: LysE family translocator [Campylobacterota bacterium]|nr:LysE family translocator [Campylobacterota bacterium]
MEDFYTTTMLLSIATFTLSTVMTPGPNNIMLLSSGLTFGYRRTLPHTFGVMFGFAFMVVLVGLGMGVLFEKYPIIFTILKIVGVLYLFWMAYKIATNDSGYDVDKSNKSKPFTFLQAAAFQWVNPKAWIMAITAISVFVTSSENSLLQVLTIAFIYLLSGVISTNSWALGGVMLKKFIKNQKSVKIFNISMAILLVVSVLPFIFE